MQSGIKPNGDCVFAANSAGNQLVLYQKALFEIPTC